MMGRLEKQGDSPAPWRAGSRSPGTVLSWKCSDQGTTAETSELRSPGGQPLARITGHWGRKRRDPEPWPQRWEWGTRFPAFQDHPKLEGVISQEKISGRQKKE